MKYIFYLTYYTRDGPQDHLIRDVVFMSKKQDKRLKTGVRSLGRPGNQEVLRIVVEASHEITAWRSALQMFDFWYGGNL